MTHKAPPRRPQRSAAKTSKHVKKKMAKPESKPIAKKSSLKVTASINVKKTLKGKEVPLVKGKDVTPDKLKMKGKTVVAVVPKVKKARAKKLPPRMRVRWCVYDAMMKPVALFDYNKKVEALASLAQYLEKKPNYFLQLVKELLPLPPEPALPGK